MKIWLLEHIFKIWILSNTFFEKRMCFPSVNHLHITSLLIHHTFLQFRFCVYWLNLEPAPKLVPRLVPSPPVAGLFPNKLPPAVFAPKPEIFQMKISIYTNSITAVVWVNTCSSVVSIPKVDVLVPAPNVRAGLLPNSPVPLPKDGVLVVVVPKPAVLFPNKFCNNTGLQRLLQNDTCLHSDQNLVSRILSEFPWG